MAQLFLDCDGVLADFDKRAEQIFGMTGPGDILVDDLTKYQHIWIENGGIFVHHTNANNSIKMLKDLKVI